MPEEPSKPPIGATGATGATGAAASASGSVPVGEVTKRAARNVAAASIAELVGKAGTFLFVVIGARALSKSDFGAFSLALAAATLLAAIPQWGFDSIIVRDGSQDPDQLPQLVAEAWVWRLGLSVPVVVGAGIFGALTNRDAAASVAFVLVVLAVVIDTLSQTWRSAAVARQDYRGVAIAKVTQRIATAMLGAGAAWLGLELLGFSSAFLIGSVIGTLGSFLAVRALHVRAAFGRVTRQGLARMGRSSALIGLDGVFAIAVLRLDAVLLGWMKGDSAVAVYAVSTRLLETVLFLAWAVVSGLMPVMSAPGATWRVRLAIQRGMTVVAAVYVPFMVVMIVAGGQVVGLLFGARYEGPSTDVVAWLAPAPLFIAFGNLASSALVARYRAGLVVGGSVAAFVVNLGLNVALIPVLGPTGSAIATTAAYLVEGIVLFVMCSRVIGAPRVDQALAVPAVAGAAMALAMVITPGGLIAQLVTGGLVFGLGWLGLSRRFAPEGVAVVMSFLRRAPTDMTVPSTVDDV